MVVTSAFYIASFVGVRGLLGWASVDRLPVDLQAAAGPYRRAALAGRRSGLDLSLGRGARRRQSAEWRPQGLPDSLPGRARGKDRQGHGRNRGRASQGGRAADLGSGEGGLIEAVREYITPNTIIETSGGDPSTGGGRDGGPACRRRGVVYAAAAAANAAQVRAIGRNWGQVPPHETSPGSARRPFAWP